MSTLLSPKLSYSQLSRLNGEVILNMDFWIWIFPLRHLICSIWWTLDKLRVQDPLRFYPCSQYPWWHMNKKNLKSVHSTDIFSSERVMWWFKTCIRNSWTLRVLSLTSACSPELGWRNPCWAGVRHAGGRTALMWQTWTSGLWHFYSW